MSHWSSNEEVSIHKGKDKKKNKDMKNKVHKSDSLINPNLCWCNIRSPVGALKIPPYRTLLLSKPVQPVLLVRTLLKLVQPVMTVRPSLLLHNLIVSLEFLPFLVIASIQKLNSQNFRMNICSHLSTSSSASDERSSDN